MFGLTWEEAKNTPLVADYSPHFEQRWQKIAVGVPPDESISIEYRKTLILRYQMLHDMHAVCLAHKDYNQANEPEFVTQCKKQKVKIHAKMTMLAMAHPFLAASNHYFENDI